MIWIGINTFFAVIMIAIGLKGYFDVADKSIGEVGGPRIAVLMAMILTGCMLLNFSIYALMEMALAAAG